MYLELNFIICIKYFVFLGFQNFNNLVNEIKFVFDIFIKGDKLKVYYV